MPRPEEEESEGMQRTKKNQDEWGQEDLNNGNTILKQPSQRNITNRPDEKGVGETSHRE